MVLYVTIALLVLVLILILPLKALFGRERPTRITSVFRFCNMRDLEHGKAMPSGDAAAAAFFCGVYMVVFNHPWLLYLCLPLVALGRVYVHCHWIGDTVIGSILGLLVVQYFFS